MQTFLLGFYPGQQLRSHAHLQQTEANCPLQQCTNLPSQQPSWTPSPLVLVGSAPFLVMTHLQETTHKPWLQSSLHRLLSSERFFGEFHLASDCWSVKGPQSLGSCKNQIGFSTLSALQTVSYTPMLGVRTNAWVAWADTTATWCSDRSAPVVLAAQWEPVWGAWAHILPTALRTWRRTH